MTRATQRRIYWETVELCLAAFFGKSQGEAHDLVQRQQAAWQEVPVTKQWSSLAYHQEALNVAEDIAGERLAWDESERRRYEQILQTAEVNVLSGFVGGTEPLSLLKTKSLGALQS